MIRLIFIDCETGGLSPEFSALLEVGLVLWDDGEIVDTFQRKIQSEGLEVLPAALAINKIKIAAHDQSAIPRHLAARQLYEWCADLSGGKRLALAGHNVDFDIGFFRGLIVEQSEHGMYEKLFSHHKVDTMSITRFLSHADKGPDSGSLKAALEYFGIRNTAPHTAIGDAVATANLYTAMLKQVGWSPA